MIVEFALFRDDTLLERGQYASRPKRSVRTSNNFILPINSSGMRHKLSSQTLRRKRG